jgi:hypothetical protein
VFSFFLEKGSAADTTDAPQQMLRTHRSLEPYCAILWWRWKMIRFSALQVMEHRMEWNWQGKTEVLGENPVPWSLCPPQFPHWLTRDRTRTLAVRGRWLTAWAMARPSVVLLLVLLLAVLLVIDLRQESVDLINQCYQQSQFLVVHKNLHLNLYTALKIG